MVLFNVASDIANHQTQLVLHSVGQCTVIIRSKHRHEYDILSSPCIYYRDHIPVDCYPFK